MPRISDYPDIALGVLKGRFLRRFNAAGPPRVIAYTTTWRCNAACDMCGIKNVESGLKRREKELSARDISKIFKDPLLGKLDLLRFTGGEPFLKEDFTEIVEEIAKNTKTKIYYITTNGFYADKILDFVKRLAPRLPKLVIRVSIDATKDTHDRIRKLPGLYEKCENLLGGLKELKKFHEFSFGINQTVTPETVKHIDDIAGLAAKYGCDRNLYLAHEAHESDILEGERHDVKLALLDDPEKNVTKLLHARIEEARDKEGRKKRPVLSPEHLWDMTEKFMLAGSRNRTLYNRNFPNPPCLAMFFYVRILPDGVVMPCTLKPKSMGSLKNKTFTAIWNSKEAQDMRREVKKCKSCWVECDIISNIIYSPALIKEAVRNIFTERTKGA